jgi:SAM-dependent methyltransferase
MTLGAHKQAEIASRTPELLDYEATKPFAPDPGARHAIHFVEWATVMTMLESVDVPSGGNVIDVGCGAGWTSLLMAEAGFEVTGYDLVPANIELARRRAASWGHDIRFEVADMEDLPDGDPADAALLFEALHHSTRPREVLGSVARRLRPGGWLLVGEPTWLHRFSPGARAMHAERGWVERGPTLTGLRRDLRRAGFGEMRRFFQPTFPYEGRGRAFAWQLIRLVAANVLAAPHGHVWLAARLTDRV